jgi:hypothetical protein
LQDYVNKEAELFSQAILNALPVRVRELKARIRWVSPLASDSYREYRDAEFLDRVGLSGHAAELAHFWPSRGPSWDALGIVSDQEGKMKPGVLLVEAKSHVAEVYGNGCQASPKSRARITQALQDAQEWVGASGGSDWLGPLYQSGNRIAHLYFLLERIRNPAWLINLYFIDDPIGPTSRRSWEREIASVKTQLGLVQRVKNMIEVFMSTFSATQNSIPEGERRWSSQWH